MYSKRKMYYCDLSMRQKKRLLSQELANDNCNVVATENDGEKSLTESTSLTNIATTNVTTNTTTTNYCFSSPKPLDDLSSNDDQYDAIDSCIYPLCQNLCNWILKHNVTHTAVNENVMVLRNGNVFLANTIAQSETGELKLNGEVFSNASAFYHKPASSLELNIMVFHKRNSES